MEKKTCHHCGILFEHQL